jgi:hypothetical protein
MARAAKGRRRIRAARRGCRKAALAHFLRAARRRGGNLLI